MPTQTAQSIEDRVQANVAIVNDPSSTVDQKLAAMLDILQARRLA